MKKPKRFYEYRWKIKIEGFRTARSWGITAVDAFATTFTVMKAYGYKNPSYFKIASGRVIVKLERNHKYGKKVLIAYVTRLKERKIQCIKRIGD